MIENLVFHNVNKKENLECRSVTGSKLTSLIYGTKREQALCKPTL